MLRCILPMRNWNNSHFRNLFFFGFLLYLTYEELKQFIYKFLLLRVCFNIVVSYLWGIETLELLIDLDIVVLLYLTYEELKLIVCSCIIEKSSHIRPLYLTYEELKPVIFHNIPLRFLGFVVSYLWGIETHF